MSMHLGSAAQLAASTGLPIADPKCVGMSSSHLDVLKREVRRLISEGTAPGVLTVISRRGKIVHVDVQGKNNVEKDVPLQIDSIFRLHSQSKPITAAAAMIACEDRLFDIDDPVYQILPEFRDMAVWRGGGIVNADSPITIRHLLMHTSGIGHYIPYPDDPCDPVANRIREAGLDQVDARTKGMALGEYVKTLAEIPLYHQPGQKWRYSLSIEVVGRLIEVASGMRFSKFLKERLCWPLGMTDTDFFVPYKKWHRFSNLYQLADGDGFELAAEGASGNFNYSREPTLESASGGLVSTASDYLRFAQMLLNRGEFDGTRILRPSSVSMIMSNQLGPEFGRRPLSSLPLPWLDCDGLGHGFGGMVLADASLVGGRRSSGEYAWCGAAGTNFWIDPVRELVGLVFMQLINSFPARDLTYDSTYNSILNFGQD